MSEAIKNKYDFMILFDVENGNPNGDPDAGNMPRMYPEAGHGIVTDVCLKRKIRDYVEIEKEDTPGYRIYVKKGVPLNRKDQEAFSYLGVDASDKDKIKAAKKDDPELDVKIRDFMCGNFYDIRTFGAVMTTFTKGALNCGQVKGPVQLGFAKSIDPIISYDIALTRTAITTEKDAEDKTTEFGSKFVVPYALYSAKGHISACQAERVTGFSEEDLALFWRAILSMFDEDRSAAKGEMAVRKLIVFKHESRLGNAPADVLFDTVHVEKKDNVIYPQTYRDYNIVIDYGSVPNGVSCIEMR